MQFKLRWQSGYGGVVNIRDAGAKLLFLHPYSYVDPPSVVFAPIQLWRFHPPPSHELKLPACRWRARRPSAK